jgi:hypothetical protein|tara:strand:- start:1087 stop:1302 length:216 start_codon:yes stop_codon:yes gene_type:complete
MSRIKEHMIGYDLNDWIEPQAHVMVDELVEYQVYCMSLSELTQRVIKQVRDEYYSNPYNEMVVKHNEVFNE